MRMDNIARVPTGMKAFYFLDEETMRKNKRALEKWQENGWTIQPYKMVEGTKYINAPRLTTKKLKFQTPSFLTDGKQFDWLIHHDANIRMNLERMATFLRARQKSALVLLDYCYEYPQCCGEGRGIECFKHSTGFYINQAPLLTPESWQELLTNYDENVSTGVVWFLNVLDAVSFTRIYIYIDKFNYKNNN